MRIGILGGSFDPIHLGHLELARAALKQLKLDQVIFVPSYRHPFEEKRERETDPQARLEMTHAGILGEPSFNVSDAEIKRGGISYTVDTLRTFRKQFPAPHELFFLTGGDWGKNLSKWKEIDAIFSLVHFVVAKRPGFDTSRLPREVLFLDFVPLDISSSKIREEIKKGRSVDRWVPKQTAEYIHQHQLYQSS